MRAARVRRLLGEHLLEPLTYRLLFRSQGKDGLPVREALHGAVDWLLVAHKAAGGRGFATQFSLAGGWGPPYPETSGYIIPTLLHAASRLGYRREELRD